MVTQPTTPNSPQKRPLKESDLPYKLLLLLLIFSSFRPDRLIPGGKILAYTPTLLIGILLLLYIQSPKKILSNAQTKLLIAFLILMVIQIPFARNAARSFSQLRSFLLFNALPFLFCIQFLNSFHRLEKYLKLLVACSLFFAIAGIAGKGLVNVPLLEDENEFCLFVNTLIPFAYFIGQNERTQKKKLFWYSCIVVFLLGNITSFSRGGFVGLVAAGTFIFYRSRQKALALLLVSIFAVILYLFAPPTYWNEMGTIKTDNVEKGTGKERFEMWKAGWKMFLDNPIIGVGAKNYGLWISDYYPYNPGKMWGRVSHSLYFTLLPEMGIIGTFLFFAMLYSSFKNHKYMFQLCTKRPFASVANKLANRAIENASQSLLTLYNFSNALFGAMVAYLVTGAFIDVLWYDYFWKFTSLWIAIFNVTTYLNRDFVAKVKLQEL